MTRKVLWIILGSVLSLALAVITPAVWADEWDQASQITFNQSVRIPGNVVLPAGTYWFRVSPNINPNLVRIFNAHRTQLLATVMTISATVTKPTDNGELKFAKQPGNQPITLISWFYPGRMTGHEFLYSSRREKKLSEDPQITVMIKPTQQVQVG